MPSKTATIAAAPRILFHWRDFAKANGLGVNFVKNEMSAGRLRSRVLNGRRVIALIDAELWLEAQLEGAPREAHSSNLKNGKLPASENETSIAG